ncbi:hypothetical protein GCM10011499_22400 [Pelagibacterium lentulum]|uniref:Uncharacterized protein n=1 Tax=Pelagibacterium lentulum TaxID=2029865 RepID=A0A916VXW8_9HYPH|nr:hypothetical protein GCM10011499_22400 [Pelagibacterium lentulum]
MRGTLDRLFKKMLNADEAQFNRIKVSAGRVRITMLNTLRYSAVVENRNLNANETTLHPMNRKTSGTLNEGFPH